MKRLMILILSACAGSTAFAQQCAYDNYYLFAINPHALNPEQKLSKLKMYLVDENEKPMMVSGTYEVNGRWEQRIDTLFFWKNKTIGVKGHPLYQREYYNIGDVYVVVFRLEIKNLKYANRYPLYKVKSEGNPGNKKFACYPTQVHTLSVQKAVRLCNNGILENFKYESPVKTLDGLNYQPIEITLGEQDADNNMQVEENTGLQYAVRFDFLEEPTIHEGLRLFSVSQARIYDTRIEKLVQEIYIPSMVKQASKDNHEAIEFADFYNRNLGEAQDFSVQMDSWRDLEYRVARQKTNFYIFNISTRLYELDTALSNYNDVFYYKPLNVMRRYDYQLTTISKIQFTYQFNNKQWELIDKNETFFNPAPPPIKYSPKACILFNSRAHTLPLQAVTGINATKNITDTFWLYNGCDDTVFITKVYSSTRDFFSINQTLLPKTSTPLIFNGVLKSNSFDFINQGFSCNLTLADNHTLSFDITVPVVSNNVKVYYKNNGLVDYAIGNQPNQRFNYAIFTYPNGNLRATGKVLDGDTTQKAGTWQYYKVGVWGIDEVVYSKAVYLSAFDEIHGGRHTGFNVKILENCKWIEPVSDVSNNEIRIFISSNTDSIMAFTDSSGYSFAVDYMQLPAQISKTFYLLKPNQRNLKIGYYEVPFQTIENAFIIIPNYAVFKNKLTNGYEIEASIIESLKLKYPNLIETYWGKYKRGIDISNLSTAERKKLLSELETDSSIGFVCQMFTSVYSQRAGYCNNLVYIESNTENIEILKKMASDLGFINVEINTSYNRFMLTYKSKISDEAFFEAFKKLAEDNRVVAAFFNTYIEAEPTKDEHFKSR